MGTNNAHGLRVAGGSPSLVVVDMNDTYERHLLAVSLLGHRIQPDGTLSAGDVADLVSLLHGGQI